MANRLVGNVYIVDSALNFVALPWNQGARVKSISAWFLNATGEVNFTDANTADVLVRLTAPNTGAGYNTVYLGGICFDNLKVPTLTAGTAWIYFS